MSYQNYEVTAEVSPSDRRLAALGEAMINLDIAYYNSKRPVQLPNLPGVSFLGKDLEG